MPLESKKIFIEVEAANNGQEKTWVDWTKNFSSLNEVIVALQMAMGAVAQEEQRLIELNKRMNGQIVRPDFVQRRN